MDSVAWATKWQTTQTGWWYCADGSSCPCPSTRRKPTESTQRTGFSLFPSAEMDMTRPARRPPKRPVSGNKKRGLEGHVCLRRRRASENPVSTHCGGGGGGGGAVHSGGRTKETPSRIRGVGEGGFAFGSRFCFLGGEGVCWIRAVVYDMVWMGWDLVDRVVVVACLEIKARFYLHLQV